MPYKTMQPYILSPLTPSSINSIQNATVIDNEEEVADNVDWPLFDAYTRFVAPSPCATPRDSPPDSLLLQHSEDTLQLYDKELQQRLEAMDPLDFEDKDELFHNAELSPNSLGLTFAFDQTSCRVNTPQHYFSAQHIERLEKHTRQQQQNQNGLPQRSPTVLYIDNLNAHETQRGSRVDVNQGDTAVQHLTAASLDEDENHNPYFPSVSQISQAIRNERLRTVRRELPQHSLNTVSRNSIVNALPPPQRAALDPVAALSNPHSMLPTSKVYTELSVIHCVPPSQGLPLRIPTRRATMPSLVVSRSCVVSQSRPRTSVDEWAYSTTQADHARVMLRRLTRCGDRPSFEHSCC